MFYSVRERRLTLVVTILLFLGLPVSSYAIDAQEVIKKIEDNLNGKTAYLKLSMQVKTERSERTMKMESRSVGKEKSFIRITYPRKDKGITFLKIDHSMWQYVPRIEKIIKIPASMMLQSWMGSDFTNDDLVRESSIVDDYTAKIIGEDDVVYEVELIPRDEAPVVWGRVVMKISKKYFLPTLVTYFDEEGKKTRTLDYQNVRAFGKKFYPTHWVVIPLDPDKEGHNTIVDIDEAVFDSDINDHYFTKKALKRFSD